MYQRRKFIHWVLFPVLVQFVRRHQDGVTAKGNNWDHQRISNRHEIVGTKYLSFIVPIQAVTNTAPRSTPLSFVTVSSYRNNKKSPSQRQHDPHQHHQRHMIHHQLHHPPYSTQQTELSLSLRDNSATKILLPDRTSYYRTTKASVTQLHGSSSRKSNNSNQNSPNTIDTTNQNKFGWKQRFASVQCLLLGAIVGSLAQAPISLLHNLLIHPTNPIAQWEYDTDASAISGGLFAIVYRYCIREDTTNPQLNEGCISAMILIRTLPQISIPSYCTSVPLNCQQNNKSPFYWYIFDDWNVLQQLLWCGIEAAVLFTVVAKMMDMAMEKQYITRFPG
jgi:hypothetical protein